MGGGIMRRLGRRNARGGSSRPPLIPMTISNLDAWWRADYGITTATGVSQWVDRKNGLALTQATGNKQPTTSAPSELGGRPALTFDGSNDVLVSTAAGTRWKYLHDGTGYTAFVACVPRAGGALSVLSTIVAAAGTGLWLRIDGASTAVYHRTYNGGTTIINRDFVHASVATATGLIYDESYQESITPEVDLRSAGVSRSSGATGSAPDTGDPTGTLSVCGFSDTGGHGKFDVAEILLYNAVLSAGDRTTVYSYLATRYGL